MAKEKNMMQIHGQLPPVAVKRAFLRSQRRSYKLFALGFWAVALGGLWAPASAQFPPCPPPAANEYLLLVRSDTEAERTRVQDLLPSNSTVMICNYLEDTVVRAGGFTNLENANAWAQYMTEVEGFQAFVARPAATAQPVDLPTTDPSGDATAPIDPSAPADPTAPTDPAAVPDLSTPVPTDPVAAFAPQPLGEGFAVLVDYQYDPETALAIQDQVGQAVGLAVHKQRSYLLIAYSPDVEGAASTMTVLAGYGISGFIVDSQEVVMLTPAIALGN
jgi:hypothetical protein